MSPTRAECVELASEILGVTGRAHALDASVQPFKGWRSRAARPGTPDVVEGFAPVMAMVGILEQFANGTQSGVEPLPDAQQFAQMQAGLRAIRQALGMLEQRLAETLGPHGWVLPKPKAEG